MEFTEWENPLVSFSNKEIKILSVYKRIERLIKRYIFNNSIYPLCRFFYV